MTKITQETLNDMIATVNAGKQYDMQTWHEKFPEFGGDDNLVQSAMDYVATYNSGKYKSEEEINAKFPEFFPVQSASGQPNKQQGKNPKHEKQSFWQTIGNSLMSAGSSLLSQMSALGNIAPVTNPYTVAADADYRAYMTEQATHSRDEKQAAAERVNAGVGSEEDERLSAGIRLTQELKEEQKKYAAEARKNVGSDATFTGLIKDGNIGGALELGMITAIESAPQMIMGMNVPGRIMLGTLTAADEYDRLSAEHPDMSVGARAFQSVATGALTQFWESKYNPLKIEGKAGRGAVSKMIRDFATRGGKETMKDIGKIVLAWGKDMAGEGLEEVLTTISTDLVNSVIGLIDKDGEGLQHAYKEAQADAAKEGKEYAMEDFLWDVGKGLVNDFIGGAMAGGYMGSVSKGVETGATIKNHIQARNEWNSMSDVEKAIHQAQANMVRETVERMSIDWVTTRKGMLNQLDCAVERYVAGKTTEQDSKLIERFNHDMEQARQRYNAAVTQPETVAKSDITETKENESDVSPTAQPTIENKQGPAKEAQQPLDETMQPAEEHKAGTPVAENKRGATIIIDGVSQHVTFSGSRVVYNEDGSIDFERSGKIFLLDSEGKVLLGNHEEMLEALNIALRIEKQNGDALLNNATPLDNSLDNPLDNPLDNDAGDAPAVEVSENAEVPAYPILEDGSPDFAQMTPEQQVAFAMENGGQEAVAETVQTAIEELNAQLESVGKKKGLVPAQRVVEKNRIRQEIAMWEQLAQQQSKEQVAEQLPEMEDSTTTDNQGNPIDANGALIVEQVESIDELTNEDFISPYRTIQLPPVSEQVGEAIGAGNKPVIIKKNILERNSIIHADLTPEQSKDILKSALYSPTLYGQNQKKKRPYNWVVINTKDKDGRNRLVLLEINNTKDNIEIVHWHYINERGLEKIKNQAEREDGQLLILPSDSSEEVGALSDPTPDIDSGNSVLDNTTDTAETIQDGKENDTATLQNTVSDGKGTKNNPDMQILNKENAEKVDLSADDVVLMHYRNGSIYRFCRKTEDGKLIPLDGGSIQTTRGGKETQWVEVEKKVVMYNGEKYYMLGSNPNSKTVNLVPVEATLSVMTNMKGNHSSVIQVEKSALTNEDGKHTFRNSEDNREKEYAQLRKNAKTLDDILDYVVFWHASGNGRVEYTLRDMLRLFSTTDNDLNRIYVGDKKYIGVMDKFLHDAGMNAESKEEVEDILKKRMSEAAVVWSQMAEKEDKINNSLSLPKMVRAFITMVNDNCRVKKGVRVVDYFAGRVEEKADSTETTYQENNPLDETPAANIEEQEQTADNSDEVNDEATVETEEQVIENEDLRLLMELEQKHKRTLEQLVTARERGNDDVAEMLLERANEIGKEIAELRDKLEFNIGHIRINEAAGRRTINYLKSAGVPIDEISEERAEEMIGETKTEELRDSGGILYGFTQNGKIYVINGRLNPNTPVHEYTHLWANVFARTNPKRWATIVSTLKQTTVWNEVLEDANYAGIKHDEQAIASEVLARLTGDYWGFINEDGKSRMDETFEKKALLARVRTVLRSFWKQVAEWLGLKTNARQSDFEAQLQEFVRRPILDLMETNFDKKFKKMQEGLDKGGTNVLSLQQISELTDILEDDIRQGNRPLVFERISHEAIKSGIAEQRTLAEVLAIVALRSRRVSRALVRDGREVTSEERASRDGSDIAMMLDLIQYAKEKGIWIEDVVDALDEQYGKENRVSVISGKQSGESEVWIDKANKRVIKAKASNYYETMEEFIEGMLLNNWLFNANKQTIIGIGIDRREGKDAIRIIYETPLVTIEESKPLSQEEKDSFMKGFGFYRVEGERVHSDPNKGEASRYTNGYFDISDLHSMNIVRDSDGVIRCIDPIIRWVRGEHYMEQTAEQQERDEWNESRLDAIFDGETEYMIGDSKEQPTHAEPMSSMQRMVNAALDQANGIRLMMKRIGEIEGKKVAANEDVRDALEAKTSKITNILNRFGNHQRRHFKKALRDIQKSIKKNGLWREGMSDYYINSERTRKDRPKLTLINVLEMYMMAKDTLERLSQGKRVRDTELAFRLLQYLNMPIDTDLNSQEQRNAVLQAMVDKFEGTLDKTEIDALWSAINECTNFTLDVLKDGGLIGDNVYQELKKSKFYVPERGFAQLESNEDVRNEVMGYNSRKGRKGITPEAMKKAEGGESMATDVIANILHLAVNAVACAEENKVRQAAFRLMENHSDACRQLGYPMAKKVWYVRAGQYDDGTPIYEAQFVKPSAEQIEKNNKILEVIRSYYETLKLYSGDKDAQEYIRGVIEEAKKDLIIVNKKDAGNASVSRIGLAGEEEPKVLVSIPTEDGDVEQYTMVFPNQPEIANALNGVLATKYSDSLLKNIGHKFSALFTTYNPLFWSRNLPRDITFILTKGTAERGIGYGAIFISEMARPATTILPIIEHVMKLDVEGRSEGSAFSKDGAIEIEFQKFLDGGGNTGFTQMKDIQAFRKEADEMVNGENLAKAGIEFLLGSVPAALNEFSELWTRFAVYRATKASLALENQMIRTLGMSMVDMKRTTPYSEEEIEAMALHDSRNFSTNFNRRGAGGLIDFFNSISMFSNAAIQGASGVYRSFESKEWQKGIRGAMSIMIIPAFMGYLLTKLTPDDEDEEKVIPDFIRQNNLVFMDKRIPLSYELIPYYRIGVNYALMEEGRLSKADGIENIALGFAQHALPSPPAISELLATTIDCVVPETDFSKENPNVWPAVLSLIQPQFMQGIIDLEQGKTWTGSNLRHLYAKDKPQWMFQDYEAELYKDISKWLYQCGGGDMDNPSITVDGKKMRDLFNASPKEIKSVIETFTPNGWVKIACYAWGLNKGHVREQDIPLKSDFNLSQDVEMMRIGTIAEMNAMIREAKENYTRIEGLRTFSQEEATKRIKQWEMLREDYSAMRLSDNGFTKANLNAYKKRLERNFGIKVEGSSVQDLMHAYIVVMNAEQIEAKGLERSIGDMERWRRNYDK